MGWLVRDNEVLASLEVADRSVARARGLLGRDGADGALLLRRTRSVHTVGMRFALDVAFLDADLRVVRVTHLAPNRVSPVVWRARHVLEAEAGSFREWDLEVGQQLEVR